MITAGSRRFCNLVDLVQAQLSDLTGADVQGIVVMLPHLKRLDVYTSLGAPAEWSDGFLRTLTWVAAQQFGDAWICTRISDELRDEFLAALKGDT